MTTIQKVAELLQADGILLGSRALGVCSPNSDYDVAILASKLPPRYRQVTKHNVSNTFTSKPLSGKVSLIQEEDLDIIIFDKQEYLDDLASVFIDLNVLPKGYLMNKKLRINLYNEGLRLLGWRHNEILP